MDKDWELLQLQKLQTSQVTSCDLNVNYTMALGSSDKKVRVLEWKTGLGFVDMFYSPLRYHKYAVTSVRFSPKGTMLASSSLDGSAILMDVLSGTKIFTMVQYNTSNIVFCEFTFDCSKVITAADDGMLCFWNLAHRCQIRQFRLHGNDYTLKALAATPDSEYLISMDSGNFLVVWFIGHITIYQPQSLLIKKNLHENGLCCDISPVKEIKVSEKVTLSCNYIISTSGRDCLVKVWDLTIGKSPTDRTNTEYFHCDLILLHVFKLDGDVLNIKFSSRGNHLVSIELNTAVKVWEVHSGRCLKTLQGHTKFVTCAAFSKDSLLLVTGSIDRTVIVWDLFDNLTLDSDLLIPCNLSCHFTHINTANYVMKNKESDQTKRYNEYNIIQKLIFPSIISSIQFQKNDILVVAGRKNVELWEKETGKLTYEQKKTLKKQKYNINYLDVSFCGSKIISCSIDGLMLFWDLNMHLTCEMKIPNCTRSLRICRFSPDSKFIAAGGDDQKVYLWDAINLEFMKIMQRHENAVTALAFAPNGEFLISTSLEGDILLQNLNQEKYAAKIDNTHDLGVICCDFSSATITETKTAETNSNLHLNCNANSGIYLLATGGNDSLVKLWEVSASKVLILSTLSGHGGSVNYVKFAPTEPYILASCSSDTTVRIWETKARLCLHVLNYHHSAVKTCSFSRNARILATGSLDKSVVIFNLIERNCHQTTEFAQTSYKLLENWTLLDFANWFMEIGCPEIANKIKEKQLNDKELWSLDTNSIEEFFGLENEKEKKKFKINFVILKKSLSFPSDIHYKIKNTPHQFLCPITHQIMYDPVICADGYVFDRAAITEWFLHGKLISPITKESITTAKLLSYTALKINIYKFLYESQDSFL